MIAVSIMIIFALIIIFRYSTTLLANETVYAGVHVNDADVAGYTYEELVDFLEREFGGDLDEKEITLKISDVTRTYAFSELGVSYDIESAAGKAFDVGRDGNPVKRLQDISESAKNGVGVEMVFAYDYDKVDEIANSVASEAGALSEDAEVQYTPTSVVVKPGKMGVSVDKDDLAAQLKDAIERFESATIEVRLKTSEPDKLNADRIFNTIYKEPVDAAYSVINHKTVEIVPEEYGQTVDKALLGNAIASLNANSETEVSIPLTKVAPAVKRSDLEGSFFQDKLGGASTNFSVNSVNNKNRKTNMTLASEKINEFVMAPGDEFAFNEVVGQRTKEAGYQMAGAFMNGQSIDDIGGGICQVSSTLYNAVLYADIDVVARQNHSYIVSYVMEGFDATVSFPAPEFKFKNSTSYPLKIVGGVDGTTISFSIMGTQVGPKKKITLSNKFISSTPFEEVVTEDPASPEGKRVVTQSGKNAYTYESYKTVQVGDEPGKTTKISTSKYKAMKQMVTVGTMPTPSGEPTPEPTVVLPAEGEEDFVSDPSAAAAGGAAGETGGIGASEPSATETDAAADPSGATPAPAKTPRPTGESQATAGEGDGAISDPGGAAVEGGGAGGADTAPAEAGAKTPRPTRTPRPTKPTEQATAAGDGAGIIDDMPQ
jgi:vancomycin resistance protein YoaR